MPVDVPSLEAYFRAEGQARAWREEHNDLVKALVDAVRASLPACQQEGCDAPAMWTLGEQRRCDAHNDLGCEALGPLPDVRAVVDALAKLDAFEAEGP